MATRWGPGIGDGKVTGMPGRRLMLAYYAMTVVVGVGTLWGDPGQAVVAAFGGRGLALASFGGGYAIFGVFGFVSRWSGAVRSERVAIAVITALTAVHGAALIAQGAWISGLRLAPNAVLMMAVWIVMFSQLASTTTIPRWDTRGLVRPRRHRGDADDWHLGWGPGVAEGSPRGQGLGRRPDGAPSGDAHSGD